MLQGIVQLLQDWYQRGRLYSLVALGKANLLDVEGGEHAGGWVEHWSPTLMFLLPFLIFLQVSQLYTGYCLLENFWSGQTNEWQIPILGIIVLLLGTCNLVVTLYTYHQKGWSNNPEQSPNTPKTVSSTTLDCKAKEQ